MMMLSRFAFLGALPCLALTPAVAWGQPLTFEFSGTVTTVPTQLASEFSVGESLVGSYTFDASAVDTDADPRQGLFSVTSFTATVGGDYTVAGGANTVIDTTDGDPIDTPGLNDVYAVDLFDPVAPVVGSFSLDFFSIGLVDTSQSVFDSDALPLTPPDLSDFDVDASLGFFPFASTTGGIALEFEVTSLTAVPEATTATLLGLGLLAGALPRRLRR